MNEKKLAEELELLKELRELVLKEISSKSELYVYTDTYPKIIKPEYEYQLKEEFWEKVKEVNAILHKKEMLKLKLEELSRIDELIEMFEEKLKGGEKNGTTN